MAMLRSNKLLSHAFEDLEEGTMQPEEVNIEDIEDVATESQELEEIGDAIEKLENSQSKLEEVHAEQEANIEAMESGEEVEGSTIILPEPEAEQSVQVEQMSDGIDEVMHQESLVLENVVGRLNFKNLDEMFQTFGVTRKKTSVSKESFNNPKMLLKEKVELYKASHESVGETIKNIGKTIWEAIKKAFEALKEFIKGIFNKIKQIPELVKRIKGKTDPLEKIPTSDVVSDPSKRDILPVLAFIATEDSFNTLLNLNKYAVITNELIEESKDFYLYADKGENVTDFVKTKFSGFKPTYTPSEISKYVIEKSPDNLESDENVFIGIFGEKGKITSCFIHKKPYLIKREFDHEKEVEGFSHMVVKSMVVTELGMDITISKYISSKYKTMKEFADAFIHSTEVYMNISKQVIHEIDCVEKRTKDFLNTIAAKEGGDKVKKLLGSIGKEMLSTTKTGTRILGAVLNGTTFFGKMIESYK